MNQEAATPGTRTPRPARPSSRDRSRAPAGAVERIARIHELSRLLIERDLAGHGISGVLPAHGGVLAFLFRQSGPVPIKDLVAFTGRAKSTVTGVVQTLERQGYLARSVDPADRRIWAVRLTSEGRALQARFEEISRHLVGTVLAGLTRHDQDTLIDLLVQLENNLTRELG